MRFLRHRLQRVAIHPTRETRRYVLCNVFEFITGWQTGGTSCLHGRFSCEHMRKFYTLLFKTPYGLVPMRMYPVVLMFTTQRFACNRTSIYHGNVDNFAYFLDVP
jgi:hypothetical protein